MLSVLLLEPHGRRHGADTHHRVIARSLVWLVSAVVAGVVKDLVLAVPPEWDLSTLTDQVGCEIVEAACEKGRLGAGLGRCRSDHVLVIVTGYQPDWSILDELSRWLTEPDQAALLLRSPATLMERLWPVRRGVVGVCAPKAGCMDASSFRDLVKRNRKAARLLSRANSLS